MFKRTRVLIAAAVIANVTALAVLFWLVLDLRADTERTQRKTSDSLIAEKTSEARRNSWR